MATGHTHIDSQTLEYVTVLADFLRQQGINLSSWLARAGLTEEQLSHPEQHFIRAAQVKRLVEDALHLSQRDDIGLLMGDLFSLAHHRELGSSLMQCTLAMHMLQLLQQFIALCTPLVAVSFHAHPTSPMLIFEERFSLDPVRAPILEAVILSTKKILDKAMQGRTLVTDVHFPFTAPAYQRFAASLFRCRLHYCQAHAAFVLDSYALMQPNTPSDIRTYHYLEAQCSEMMHRLKHQNTITARVQRLLITTHSQGFPSLATCAHLLCMTPRTLHRHLCAEGSHYQTLLDEVRLSLAKHQLSAQHSVEQIALRLGYTDSANFRRFFRRMTGKSPSAWRETSKRAQTH